MRFKIITPFLFFVIICIPIFAQEETRFWKILENIEYEIGYDEYGEIYIPKFDTEITSLDGKEIVLPGYIIPFQGLFKPKEIIISALPIVSCFFCGSGGPETVAKAYLVDNVDYTAKKVIVTGLLYLNKKDPEELMYILKNAKIKKYE